MAAGLPATGLGGVFYLLLVAMMPLREAWRAVMRRGPRRWRPVLLCTSLGAGIVASIALEGWLLVLAFRWVLTTFPQEGPMHNAAILATRTVTPAVAALPFILLASVTAAIHGLRLIFGRDACRRRSLRLGAAGAKGPQC
jgi:hypothetical protein